MNWLDKALELYAMGYPVIPVNGKAPMEKEWQKGINANRVAPNGNFDKATGCGVVLGHRFDNKYLAAIDVDCYDGPLSKKLVEHISDKFGVTPSYRVGLAPKFLIPVLVDYIPSKLVSTGFDTNGKVSRIEILGKGSQFVAYGEYGTNEYKWYNGDMDTEKLLHLTYDDVINVMQTFEQMAEEQGFSSVKKEKQEAVVDDFMYEVKKEPIDITLDEVKTALRTYKAEGLEYDAWVKVGQALHHQFKGNKTGWQLWVTWSAQSSKHDDKLMAMKWKSFGKTNGREVTFATVLGYANKMKKEEFDSIDVVEPKVELDDTLFQSLTDEYQNADHIVEWTIKGILENRVIANLYGPSGVGKSYFAIDMAMCIATGMDWHGHKVKQGKVLYVCGEGHKGVNRRVRAWREIHGGTHGDNMVISTRPINIAEKSGMEQLVKYLSLHDDVKMLVIDTLGRSIAGRDENNAQDIQPIIDKVDILSKDHNMSSVFVHHTAKHTTTTSAGSKNIRASMDVEFAVEKDDELIKLECRKMKEGEYFEPMAFSFKRVQLPHNYDDEYGDPTYSAVLVREEERDDEAKMKSKKLTPNDIMLLEAFEYVYKKGTHNTSIDTEIVREFGLDGPSQGVFEEVVREEFYRRLGDHKTKRVPYNRAKQNLSSAKKLVIRDELFIKHP